MSNSTTTELLLPFCHAPGVWGVLLTGFLFVPLAGTAILCALTYWSRETLINVYSLYVNVIFLLALALQVILAEAVPDPNCYGPTSYLLVAISKPFTTGPVPTTAYGTPSLDAVIIGALVAFVAGYHIIWRQPIRLGALLAIVLSTILVPISLWASNVATGYQIGLGLLLGAIPAVPTLLWTRDVLWRDTLRFLRGDRLVTFIFGSKDTMIAIKPYVVPPSLTPTWYYRWIRA